MVVIINGSIVSKRMLEIERTGIFMVGSKSLWPNQREVVDGVIPVDEVPQDPNIFDDEDLNIEMSD